MTWKLTVTAAIFAAGLCTTGAARADYEDRLIGNWITNAKEDRFGEGGTFTAFTIRDGQMFGLRCIEKELSFGVVDKDLTVGDVFVFKFRVDRNDVFTEIGRAINKRLIQITTSPALIRQMRAGKELAVRKESDSSASTFILKLRGSNRAFEDIVKACPLEQAEKASSKENVEVDAPADTKAKSALTGKESETKPDALLAKPVPTTREH